MSPECVKVGKFFDLVPLSTTWPIWYSPWWRYNMTTFSTLLAPVPLSIFRSNSKFDENSECYSFEYARSQRYLAHVTTVTLSWRVQNIVVIGRVYFTLECFEFSSNFEFDRNMLSGTGARSGHVWIAVKKGQYCWALVFSFLLALQLLKR